MPDHNNTRTPDAPLRPRLKKAAASLLHTRLERRLPGADPIEGFVLRAGRTWTLVASISDMRFDGFTAVRTHDVETVLFQGPKTLTTRWLRTQGSWPPPTPTGRIRLGSTENLLRSVAAHHPLLALFEEDLDPNICHIGTLTSTDPTESTLLEVTPNAHWHSTPTTYPHPNLTRIDFADHYLHALQELAGPPHP
ncbi:hypothetical protein GCM10010329_66690 [Streptomyces spiroverticillatus]|uniref:Uncharacterized protein n=1 Tax=Streptomyces finlayi TaxID=67296 RepID=A0A918X4Q8_9ACTN|nr:hypothetical protein [Streptomyces finlayi]GHA34213.1 hypothetical protein GCM10010329_66690 [Streptomyces spiroverticillatus]GHD11787.1 hypothetical protein GCM10010334_68240 [Streptomyces finlayi]